MQAKPPASPACLAHEISGAYMGFLPPGELLCALTSLLQAEQLLQMAALDLPTGLLPGLSANQTHWCKQLRLIIQRLGGTPPQALPLLKAPDTAPDFIQHHLTCLVQRLTSLLPTIQDDTLHAQLKPMLHAHLAALSALGDTG